jgi:hypothetical protein
MGMTVTALMVFILVSQICMFGYLLYSFNDIERESRKRMADLRAHIDAVCNDLRETRESMAREGTEGPARKRAVG